MLAEIITRSRDFADVMYLIGFALATLAALAHTVADKWRDLSPRAPHVLLAGAVAAAELGLLAG